MKKKVVSMLLTGVMVCGLVTGCGGSSSNSSGGASEDTITVMCVGTEADEYVAGYEKIAEDFSADNEYGVTVKIDFYENEQYKTKLTTLMASNAVPDIFFTWELSYLEPFVAGGKTADLTPYLDEDTEWKNSFADGTLDLVSYDDKTYAIPTQKSLCVMFYNKTIFEDNNLEIPTTYDEFLAACDTLKSNGITPMALCGSDAWIPAQFVQQIAAGMAGDDLFQSICDGSEKWNNETNVKAAEEVKKMADKEYFNNGYIGTSPEEAREIFTSGKAAMWFMGAWEVGNLMVSDIGDSIGVFSMPAFDSQYNNISVGSIDTSFAVSENCKNKDAAVAFLKYWTQAENEGALLYNYGRIPANNFEIDDSQLSELQAAVIEASNAQVGLQPWWDRQFGAGEGVEYNNTCVAVLGGEDAQDAFDELQQFADDNANR